MRRKELLHVTIALVATVALAACGGGEDVPEAAATPAPEPTEEVVAEDFSDADAGVVETDEPLEEDTFELEATEPPDDAPVEDDIDREPLSADGLAELPDVTFDVIHSPVPGVPFPADYVPTGRTADPYTSDYGYTVCNYRQEFETSESMQELSAWFTELMRQHGYEVERDREDVVGTNWYDPDSPELPGGYSLGTLWPEEGGGTSGISFETTVFDVESEGFRSVYVQLQTVGDCA